jgi:hypothetical protein
MKKSRKFLFLTFLFFVFKTPILECKANHLNYILNNWNLLNPKDKFFVEKGLIEISYTFHSDDSAKFEYISEDPIAKVLLIEERTGKIVFQKTKTKNFTFKKKVNFTDVYTIKFFDNSKKYFRCQVFRKPTTILSARQSSDFKYDTTLVKKGFKGARKVEEIKLVKVLNEPRKLVLSRGFTISGVTKIILPLELPKGTFQLLYQVIISGEDKEKLAGKRLFSDVSFKVNQYNVLGKTIFETRGEESSLSRELFNTLVSPARERFSANIYFFSDPKNAHLFADGSSKYHYDIRNSLLNTESLNGLVKPQKNGFVYFGFQSTSSLNATYIWVDAVALRAVTKYVTTKKVPKESTSY